MKYAISHLRIEEHRLQVNIEELRLKTGEIPPSQAVRDQAAQQRQHMLFLIDVSIERLDDVRKALKLVEKI